MVLKIRKPHIYVGLYLFLMLYKPTLLPVSMNYLLPIWGIVGCVIHANSLVLNYWKMPLQRFFITVSLTIIYLFFVLSFTSGNYSLLNIYFFMYGSFFQGVYAVILLKKYYGDYDSAMDVIVRVGLVQCAICILMMLIPGFRTSVIGMIVANQGNSDVLTNAMSVRLYGIAGEYLYSIGLIHGVLAVYLFHCSIRDRNLNKAILAVIMLIPALLNARVGVVCAIISTLFILACYFLKYRYPNKIRLLKIVIIVVITVAICMNACKILIPSTYEWIQDGIQAVFDLLLGQENQYYGKLTTDFLVWPSGKEFIWGKGIIPGGKTFLNLYGYVSDIGYVIDVHVGGIILGFIFYLGCIWSFGSKFPNKSFDQKVLVIASILFVAFANYKGRIAGATDTLILIMIILGNYYFEEKRGDIYGEKY